MIRIRKYLRDNMLRADVINLLIGTYGYKRYLEIGTSKRDENFNKIKNVEGFCIDPEADAEPDFLGTSDQYFSFLDQQDAETRQKSKYDIIFIDGMHEDKQVRKDIENSLRYLNPNGAIVLHDCSPEDERAATPYDELKRQSTRHMGFNWNGDVYKAFVHYKWEVNKDNRNTCFTVDCDFGCGVILTDPRAQEIFPAPAAFTMNGYNADTMRV
ncbi:hypothetical protein M2132_001324 [Dysgonomonas sp. PH5-45]|uniref:class I SAM-dependent methyltransferase n=1 Tax=unclassified Dysgonomonas TaxID=2630389 RepID=UPI0024768F95|nr:MULTISPECIES: class I SAM-dependent methyltransferase [unclassified Dysgonomonas]MDH6354987.1 hypothetical protein [Dysgonomonas sp. PH5-45]MDH6387889.1 hypothetical protein [Dysgonomonas sp. PH5-37]